MVLVLAPRGDPWPITGEPLGFPAAFAPSLAMELSWVPGWGELGLRTRWAIPLCVGGDPTTACPEDALGLTLTGALDTPRCLFCTPCGCDGAQWGPAEPAGACPMLVLVNVAAVCVPTVGGLPRTVLSG